MYGKELLDDQHSCAGVLGRNRSLSTTQWTFIYTHKVKKKYNFIKIVNKYGIFFA